MRGWILLDLQNRPVRPSHADGWWGQADAERYAADRYPKAALTAVPCEYGEDAVLVRHVRCPLPSVYIRVVDGRTYLTKVLVDGRELAVTRVRFDTGERIDGHVAVHIDTLADVVVVGEAETTVHTEHPWGDDFTRTGSRTGSDDEQTGVQTGADAGTQTGTRTGLQWEWRSGGEAGSGTLAIAPEPEWCPVCGTGLVRDVARTGSRYDPYTGERLPDRPILRCPRNLRPSHAGVVVYRRADGGAWVLEGGS